MLIPELKSFDLVETLGLLKNLNPSAFELAARHYYGDRLDNLARVAFDDAGKYINAQGSIEAHNIEDWSPTLEDYIKVLSGERDVETYMRALARGPLAPRVVAAWTIDLATLRGHDFGDLVACLKILKEATRVIKEAAESRPAGESAPEVPELFSKFVFDAAKAGNVLALKAAVNADASVNLRDDNNSTPLMWAALYGHDNAVRYLLEEAAEANAANDHGVTALMFAAGRDRAVTERLLNAGATIEVPDKAGNTALIHAAAEGCAKAAQLLLERGANVDAINDTGDTALLRAVVSRASVPVAARLDVIRHLVRKGANVKAANKHGNTALHLAAAIDVPLSDHAELARLLLGAGADVDAKNKDGNRPLHLASRAAPALGYADVARMLLDVGRADPNARNNAEEVPLHSVVPIKASDRKQHRVVQEVVDLLKRTGADIHAQDKFKKSVEELCAPAAASVIHSNSFTRWLRRNRNTLLPRLSAA